jgi:hypothetical protein
MKRVVNPFVSRILRSRYHRLLSGHLALLEVAPRSGRTFDVPVLYRAHGPEVFRIDVGAPQAKRWWRVFRAPGPVGIWLGGRRRDAAACAVEQDGRVSVVVSLDPPPPESGGDASHSGRRHRPGPSNRPSGVVRQVR